MIAPVPSHALAQSLHCACHDNTDRTYCILAATSGLRSFSQHAGSNAQAARSLQPATYISVGTPSSASTAWHWFLLSQRSVQEQ